jgi:hypothetical protein
VSFYLVGGWGYLVEGLVAEKPQLVGEEPLRARHPGHGASHPQPLLCGKKHRFKPHIPPQSPRGCRPGGRHVMP